MTWPFQYASSPVYGGHSLAGNSKHPYRVLVLLITTEAIMNISTKVAQQAEQSYNRAVSNVSVQNDLIVVQEFKKRGITATPRTDVFTYNTWLYKFKRQVRKGEKSVKVRTIRDEETNGVKTGKKRPATACLFHISQTDSITDEG